MFIYKGKRIGHFLLALKKSIVFSTKNYEESVFLGGRNGKGFMVHSSSH